MKKIATMMIAMMFGLLSILPAFLSSSKAQSTSAVSTDFSEELLDATAFDIVSTYKSKLDSSLVLYSKSNEAPFDSETNSPMEGVSIEPTSSSGEIDATFTTQSFSISSDMSIYVWIFFPDDMFYDLTISFSTQTGESVSWTYDWDDLTDLISKAGASSYGWKLFEFCVSDAELTGFDLTELGSQTFETMTFQYKNNLGLISKVSYLNLSFFHVYGAESYGEETSVLISQKYAYYSVSDEFLANFDNLFVGDSCSFGTFLNMFDYIYVAKYDFKQLKSSLFNYFESEVKLSTSDDGLQNSTYTFSSSGWCSLSIKLSQINSDGTVQIINFSKAFYVEQFVLGSFSKASYELDEGETLLVTFKLLNSFVLDGELTFEISDKNIASISYYNEGNTYYISVTGLSSGETTITATASGGRSSEDVSEYMQTAKISVEEVESSSLFITIILWSTLALYLIGFVIYVIIALVNSKKSRPN